MLQHDLLHTLENRQSIREVCFVGHSAGSAMAQIAALYFGSLLKETHPDVDVTCIGLGGPKMGSGDDLQQAFDLCINDHVRIINEDDIVPFMPPPFLDFKHVGAALWLHDGKVFNKVDDKFSSTLLDAAQCCMWYVCRPLKGINDHSLTFYQNNMMKCLSDTEAALCENEGNKKEGGRASE